MDDVGYALKTVQRNARRCVLYLHKRLVSLLVLNSQCKDGWMDGLTAQRTLKVIKGRISGSHVAERSSVNTEQRYVLLAGSMLLQLTEDLVYIVIG